MELAELAFSICLGIGLSAACGFRVFLPLLGMSLAALAGQLELSPGFEWVGTWTACACFLTATVLEVVAYYVPWVDNLLDTIATPAAVVAGTVVAASVMTDIPPLAQWSLAFIAGGGTAGIVQSLTVAVRGTSTSTTGGLGNFVVSTVELIASFFTTLLALVLPIFCAGIVLLGSGLALSYLGRRRQRHNAKTAG